MVDMLNINSALGNGGVIFTLFCGQPVVFRSFDRRSAVLMEIGSPLITFVSKDFRFRRKMDAAILQQGKIMLSPCCC